jgi:NodT family efflux transporter outer membrane factor (OMF) lipoprotein
VHVFQIAFSTLSDSNAGAVRRRCRRFVGVAPGLLASLLLGGCTMLGPDYSEPEVDVQPSWLEADDPQVSTAPPLDSKWWSSAFHDAELDRLMDMALNQNLSLRSAGLRVLQAQQQLAIAIGNQYPQQQQISGLAAREKAGGISFNDYSVGFNLSWEIDFWGRFKREVESASANLDASVANYDVVLVSLAAQVAQTYILIRTFKNRIKVNKENVQYQKEALRVAKAKFDAGERSELDADQAESLLYNTRATVSGLEVSLQQLKNSLATLLGKPPQEFNYLLGEDNDIPAAAPELALGMPQDLIRRRPDIRLAERQLAAQSAQIGVAETELYPAFSIGGAIGTSAMSGGDLFTNASETFNLFGAFQWNIFNYGRLKSNVRLQDALFQQLLVDYQDTVLQAQGEVENAIVAYLKSHEQLASYRQAATASQKAVDVSRAQYEVGLVDFTTVVQNLASNLQQQDQLSSTQGTVGTNLVEVYKSLGGGWAIRANSNPVDFLPAAMKEQMRERTEAWEGVLE